MKNSSLKKLISIALGLLIMTLISLDLSHADGTKISYAEFARIEASMKRNQAEIRDELLKQNKNYQGLDDALNSYEAQELLKEIADAEAGSIY